MSLWGLGMLLRLQKLPISSLALPKLKATNWQLPTKQTMLTKASRIRLLGRAKNLLLRAKLLKTPF